MYIAMNCIDPTRNDAGFQHPQLASARLTNAAEPIPRDPAPSRKARGAAILGEGGEANATSAA
jgi:hypothetical protein